MWSLFLNITDPNWDEKFYDYKEIIHIKSITIERFYYINVQPNIGVKIMKVSKEKMPPLINRLYNSKIHGMCHCQFIYSTFIYTKVRKTC